MLSIMLVSGNARSDVPFLGCFQIASLTHTVPIDLLIAVARVESGFDPDARSVANAHGIMQVRWPITARHLGVRRIAELYNPCVNIDLGSAYLAELLDRYDRDETLALAAYNYGPSRLTSKKDIPDSVYDYVTRVEMARDDLTTPAIKNTIVNIFDRGELAEKFSAAINSRVPSAHFFIRQTEQGFAVYLEDEKLTNGDRLILNRLYSIY